MLGVISWHDGHVAVSLATHEGDAQQIGMIIIHNMCSGTSNRPTWGTQSESTHIFSLECLI